MIKFHSCGTSKITLYKLESIIIEHEVYVKRRRDCSLIGDFVFLYVCVLSIGTTASCKRPPVQFKLLSGR